ncbi:MAG TPA: nucleotidyltransferase domain-containing protein [Bacteroidales bacterium]|nr:nucleotidyltransferase domain-containing protein [Bacteroidales bacterium]
MLTQSKYITAIVEKLKPTNPYAVILFGSCATNEATENSDIDLIVVSSETTEPKNYTEKLDLQYRVSNLLYEIALQTPIDLIVFTLPMYRKFLEQNSSFAKEIKTKGKILYEANNGAVA